MLIIFFIGIGAGSIITSLGQTPLQVGAGLLVIGLFASIYHPVGIAMVVEGSGKTGMALAINGVFGNMGVASAALIAGWFIEFSGWRSAFALPGIAAILTGIAYGFYCLGPNEFARGGNPAGKASSAEKGLVLDRRTLIWIFAIIFFSTSCGSLIFQSTTFTLPKMFDERLGALADNASEVGSLAFLVFAVAAFGQLPVGHLIDRYSIRGVFSIVAGLQIPLFVLVINLAGWPVLWTSMAFMLLVFGQIPINDALVARITRSQWRSRVYALKFILTFGISATAVPMIAALHSSGGFSALFQTVAVVASLMFAAVLMLPQTTTAPALSASS